jgi:hypothetical protein
MQSVSISPSALLERPSGFWKITPAHYTGSNRRRQTDTLVLLETGRCASLPTSRREKAIE